MDHRERAKAIVEAIVKDMTGRRGLRQEFDGIDKAVQDEIVNSWCDIVSAAIDATDAIPAIGTFGWAVRQHRPMRRAAWLKHPPVGARNEEAVRAIVENAWVYLRVLVDGPKESRWIWITSGLPMQLVFADYVGCDWEVM